MQKSKKVVALKYPENAEAPILVTPSGMLMLAKELHLENA